MLFSFKIIFNINYNLLIIFIMEDEILKNEVKSELTGFNKGEKAHNEKLLMLAVGIGSLLIIIIIVIIIIVVLTNRESNKKIIGEINCLYFVETLNEPILLLGNDFKKESDFDIYIDNKLIKYSKEYKFDSIGNHNLQIKLYKSINMDYMFNDVKGLISIEMFSENNCKIISMISTFENCTNLAFFNITGFNGDEILSMHKLFYRSGLSSFYCQFNFTSNVEDISYMFAFSSIRQFMLSDLNLNKVKNMSHMFENCASLENIVLFNLETNNIKDNILYVLFM